MTEEAAAEGWHQWALRGPGNPSSPLQPSRPQLGLSPRSLHLARDEQNHLQASLSKGKQGKWLVGSKSMKSKNWKPFSKQNAGALVGTSRVVSGCGQMAAAGTLWYGQLHTLDFRRYSKCFELWLHRVCFRKYKILSSEMELESFYSNRMKGKILRIKKT